jgi:hypothetical protein
MSCDVLFTGPDDDLTFTDELVDSLSNMAVSAQQIESALLISRREWFIDATRGIDWLAILTSKDATIDSMRRDIQDALTDVPDVNINSVEVSREGRAFSAVIRASQRGRQFIGTLALDPSRDRMGDNALLASFYPQFVVRPIAAR